MSRKMKEMHDLEKRVVLCQIESVRDTFKQDSSNDAKLTLLQNTLHIVEKNKATFGKVKNMSSLEKNRIALNLISSVKLNEKAYRFHQQQNIAKNLRHQEDCVAQKLYKKFGSSITPQVPTPKPDGVSQKFTSGQSMKTLRQRIQFEEEDDKQDLQIQIGGKTIQNFFVNQKDFEDMSEQQLSSRKS